MRRAGCGRPGRSAAGCDDLAGPDRIDSNPSSRAGSPPHTDSPRALAVHLDWLPLAPDDDLRDAGRRVDHPRCYSVVRRRLHLLTAQDQVDDRDWRLVSLASARPPAWASGQSEIGSRGKADAAKAEDGSARTGSWRRPRIMRSCAGNPARSGLWIQLDGAMREDSPRARRSPPRSDRIGGQPGHGFRVDARSVRLLPTRSRFPARACAARSRPIPGRRQPGSGPGFFLSFLGETNGATRCEPPENGTAVTRISSRWSRTCWARRWSTPRTSSGRPGIACVSRTARRAPDELDDRAASLATGLDRQVS